MPETLNPKVLLWPENTMMDFCPQCQDWFPDRLHKCPNKYRITPVTPSPAPLIAPTPEPEPPPSTIAWPPNMNRDCLNCSHCQLYSSAQFNCTFTDTFSGPPHTGTCPRRKEGRFSLTDPYDNRKART